MGGPEGGFDDLVSHLASLLASPVAVIPTTLCHTVPFLSLTLSGSRLSRTRRSGGSWRRRWRRRRKA
eukprot:2400899-Rhodomonas_salina.1